MRKLNSPLLAILAFTAAGSAFAADANLEFTGTILPASCKVDTSTATQTIDLKSALVTDFTAVVTWGLLR